MTDDFYLEDESNPIEEGSNPFAKRTHANDYEDYSSPTHRSTRSGVLSSYKKQMNLTAEDVIKKDYWDNMKEMKTDMASQFEKADRANFTKTMVQRLRLRRGLQSPIDAAGDEYGNYKKFEEGAGNSVR